MTSDVMSCEYFNNHLMAYLENEADDATRVAMERHALTCAECGAQLADLRKLRVDAANLPALTPSRDLWTGIAERIEAPVVPIWKGGVGRISVSRSIAWPRVALIAASLIAAAGMGYFAATARGRRVIRETVVPPVARVPDSLLSQSPSPSPSIDSSTRVATSAPATSPLIPTRRPKSSAPSAPSTGGTPGAPNLAPSPRARPLPVQLAVATLTADYDREIARLRVLIDQRRNQLDPVTVAIIEKNLQVIDTAIVQCRKAIARDPASRFLMESLNQSLQTKVELMRIAALSPSRT